MHIVQWTGWKPFVNFSIKIHHFVCICLKLKTGKEKCSNTQSECQTPLEYSHANILHLKLKQTFGNFLFFCSRRLILQVKIQQKFHCKSAMKWDFKLKFCWLRLKCQPDIAIVEIKGCIELYGNKLHLLNTIEIDRNRSDYATRDAVKELIIQNTHYAIIRLHCCVLSMITA